MRTTEHSRNEETGLLEPFWGTQVLLCGRCIRKRRPILRAYSERDRTSRYGACLIVESWFCGCRAMQGPGVISDEDIAWCTAMLAMRIRT